MNTDMGVCYGRYGFWVKHPPLLLLGVFAALCIVVPLMLNYVFDTKAYGLFELGKQKQSLGLLIFLIMMSIVSFVIDHSMSKLYFDVIINNDGIIFSNKKIDEVVAWRDVKSVSLVDDLEEHDQKDYRSLYKVGVSEGVEVTTSDGEVFPVWNTIKNYQQLKKILKTRRVGPE